MLESLWPPHKMVKHTQAIRRQQPRNYFSVFDHFEGRPATLVKRDSSTGVFL